MEPPRVFVCENNRYGMGTSAERSSSNTKYFTRVIKFLVFRRMEWMSYRSTTHVNMERMDYLRKRTVTTRFVTNDISKSRRDQHMRSTNDPITGLRNRLLEWNVIEEAKTEVDIAVEEAKKSPELIRQRQSTPSLPHPYFRDICTQFSFVLMACRICGPISIKGTAPKSMLDVKKKKSIIINRGVSGTVLLIHSVATDSKKADYW
ncbi:hypothetical protein H4Q26_009529 [Puccinia striiformis f. sp. tritici PST-130]|nr:hypothetical protein H4Q26_009529 [Puccinia striiformis f. sp. tritici PST-130]